MKALLINLDSARDRPVGWLAVTLPHLDFPPLDDVEAEVAHDTVEIGECLAGGSAIGVGRREAQEGVLHDILRRLARAEDARRITHEGRAVGGVEQRGGISLLHGTAFSRWVQREAVGNQAGGRVFLFLQTDDFARDHAAMLATGVTFEDSPRHEPYGSVAIWRDPFGNRWDLIGPPPG